MDSAVRAALAVCKVVQAVPRREGFTAFDARAVAQQIAVQTGADRTAVLFELRAWAQRSGGSIKPRACPEPVTRPRTLFLYVPDRLVDNRG